MNKRIVNMLLIAGLGAVCLGGCQKAPEVSENGGIPHARSNVEKEVADAAAQGSENGADGSALDALAEQNTAEGNMSNALAEQGGFYDNVIGTQENGIWIYAEVPAVAENISRLTLTARADLDEDTLRAFLGSQSGTVQDITQQYLAEREAELNAPPVEVNAGDGIELSKTEVMTHFGNDSTLVFSDGERTVAFIWNTTVFFRDEKLRERYFEIAASAQSEKELDGSEGNEDAPFTMAQAEELLMEKLGTLGITEIDYKKIYYYEHDGEGGYEIYFTPRFEGIGLAQEFGMHTKEEIIPDASVLLVKEGAAEVNLWNALGKIGEKKDVGKILGFSQVEDILEKYLEGNVLVGCAEAKLTQAEVVYYPVYQEKESELELIPAWHIYVPLDQYVDGIANGEAYVKANEKGAVWNIYLDAVTGELLRAE